MQIAQKTLDLDQAGEYFRDHWPVRLTAEGFPKTGPDAAARIFTALVRPALAGESREAAWPDEAAGMLRDLPSPRRKVWYESVWRTVEEHLETLDIDPARREVALYALKCSLDDKQASRGCSRSEQEPQEHLEEVPAGEAESAPRLPEGSHKLYRSLYNVARNAFLLVDRRFRITALNREACGLFGYERGELEGRDLRMLAKSPFKQTLEQVIDQIKEDRVWVAEMAGLRRDGSTMPVEFAVTRVDLSSECLFHVVARDLSTEKRLKKRLQVEQSQVSDMRTTLANVMRAIDDERQALADKIMGQVRIDILPALERMAREESGETRRSYLAVIEDMLLRLCEEGSQQLDGQFLKLTPTELDICRYIQSGRTTKEICELMHTSFETVQTHRKNIRKKLDLRGKKTPLHTYLKTRMPVPAQQRAN